MSASQGPSPVLVVGDVDGSLGVVVMVLRHAGLEVLEAQSGHAALETARVRTIGLMILDTAMSGTSGAEVVRDLRSRSETATVPVLLIAASGDDDSVVQGLDAGADDFVPMTIGLDELVARVNAHLRRQAMWSSVVEEELRARARVVTALGRLAIPSVPEEAAEAVVRELAKRTDSVFVTVMQVGGEGQLLELATYDRASGVRRGGHPLPPSVARGILARARAGPWVDDVEPLGPGAATFTFAADAPRLAAGAPIHAGDDLVGILTIGVTTDVGTSPLVRRSNLMAAVIDYANVLSTRAGAAFADRRDAAASRARLSHVLTSQQFRPVFQPIVELAAGTIVGYEALTRFDDGTPPEVRFAEAAGVGLGADYELATIRAALHQGARLRDDVFLAVNVTPEFLLGGNRRFRRLIAASTRPLVLELSEHQPIDDYRLVRDALARLGGVGVAVDDAGAGFASLRHILELQPMYAKLDFSLVRGIDTDDIRQALAAGLQYFASRIGCRLIAEGVEARGEADALGRLGVALAQGYLFGRPEVAA